jgi:intracellular septation protein A
MFKEGLVARVASWLRKNGLHTLFEVLVNVVLPFIIYSYAEYPLGSVRALLASSLPPILWSLAEFARYRRLDALSLLVLSGIALSLLAMLGGGGVRFLQLREKMVTAAIGLAFLGSALIGKPLVYELARATMRRKSEEEAQKFEALQIHAGFRRTMMVMTLVWGFGLLAEFALSVALMFALSIREYLLVHHIVGYGTMGALSLWSFLYGRRAQRRGEARRAEAAALELSLNDAVTVKP